MTFSKTQIEALSAKLDPAHVKSRKQAGRELSYIEGWMAISEANRIFGFDGWSSETVDLKCVSERERKIGQSNPRDGWGVSYTAKVRVIVHGIVREGVGSGHGIDVDCGLAHESAIKEAETDARKRALMTFGNPFGLALYDKEQAQVGCEKTPPPPSPSIVAKASESLALATAMLTAIQNCETLDELREWYGATKADGSFDRLTDGDYDRVSTAYKNAKTVKSPPMVDAGGHPLTNIHAG